MPLVDYTRIPLLFLILFLSLAVREAAQVWIVDVLGDPAPAGLGRLSFNPRLQADVVGSLVFPVVSFVAGYPFMGWGKPVPIDVQEFGAAWRWKLLLAAAMGPAISLGIAVAAALAIRAGVAATDSPFDAIVAPLVFRVVDVNVVLCVFSLVPLPPLDGGTIVAAALPAHLSAAWRGRQRLGALLLFVLLLTGVLGRLVSPIRASIVGVLL